MNLKRRCVLVCQGRSCQRNGASAVLEEFRSCTQVLGAIFVAECDCTGQCSSGPTVRVTPDQSWYCRVNPDDVRTIVDQHLVNDEPVESLLHPRFHPRIDSFSETTNLSLNDDEQNQDEPKG